MSGKDALRRFHGAMRTVYGSFEELDDDQTKNWTPPDSPGAGGHHGRYLWTDAFGVVNFITLFRETKSPKYLVLASRLVETVHDVLGKNRDGSARLPGATDDEPLNGGLRIGKEGAVGGNCDGQYHHYLTIWMFALNRLSIALKDPKFNDLAIQLAKAIHPHFVLRQNGGDFKVVWKTSVDLKKVLVSPDGHLDAATGYVVCTLLQETATAQGHTHEILRKPIEDYANILSQKGKLVSSGDMLDIGMSLWIAHFFDKEDWAAALGEDTLRTAHAILGEDSRWLLQKASQRLAFREFGACMGISCFGGDEYLTSRVASTIKFWEGHLENESAHLRPISQVMYASAVIPGAFRKGYIGLSEA